MWPEVGLCCGTIRQASLTELIEVAGLHDFPSITITPQMTDEALTRGIGATELRQRLADRGVRVSYLDALTRDVPGAAQIDQVPALWRRNWTYGLDDLLRMAEVLEVPTINVTHFLGSPMTPAVMAEGIARLAARAARHGRALALEFMPNTSVPDAAAAAQVVRLTGATNVGLMLDTWHLLRAGGTAADIRSLPPGSLRGVQLNDRRSDAWPPSDTGESVSERSLPGEGDAPLDLLVQAIVQNTPAVSIELEVFSTELATVLSETAAARVATALRTWRTSLGPIKPADAAPGPATGP